VFIEHGDFLLLPGGVLLTRLAFKAVVGPV